ncbi:MAG: hypothetical protein JNK64_14850 [Myxococcales bacterium]|nr:hypothetical protein [Myxococcales bacterium]
MPTLSDYVNVFGEATAVLHEKGYQVWYAEASKLFFAEKDGWDFAADSPTALLGVVAIYEARQPKAYREYWWSTPHDWDFAAMPRQPNRPYRSVMRRD